AIPEFLAAGSLDYETRLVFLNALHFQRLWKVPFDPKLTQERMFHCANGSTVPVHMMRLTNHFSYALEVRAKECQERAGHAKVKKKGCGYRTVVR
ncbi:hypothetical protein GOODEAATRI_018189, partial [Goodea atripinnis]